MAAYAVVAMGAACYSDDPVGTQGESTYLSDAIRWKHAQRAVMMILRIFESCRTPVMTRVLVLPDGANCRDQAALHASTLLELFEHTYTLDVAHQPVPNFSRTVSVAYRQC